ncbi:YycH family regulatory protein [Cohnella sp. REN36]|uniref:YycH family regulatory protein n=1 Tax=Cohnella sp. REN36 TaxID=2887347 RepID=UPI001D14B590|nr:two-component system activity regulator YycH [Cohnella sp. REN36]MCC3377366.1 two-component system activity regulator YycH [Cohnella sp. REN36]
MIERFKSLLLVLLVGLSLVQSYFLAYSMPSMDAKVKTDQDYVKTEPLGPEEKVEKLLFPEELVLHMGQDKHTVFYPNDTFFSMVLDKLVSREFKSFQRVPVEQVNWEQVRKEEAGIEVRFGREIPFELLRRVYKIDADFLFSGDAINRIWIFARPDSGEVRSFFFSTDGRNVYESSRADLTVQDVEQSVGFGQYWKPYRYWANGVYIPDQSLPVTRLSVKFSRYTPDQMQRNLFSNPNTTRMIQDTQDGTQIYMDSKRGLKVEEAGSWMSYKDPVAPAEGKDDLTENIAAAVQFVNQHGGWNGRFRLVRAAETGGGASRDNAIRFQQYYNEFPIVSGEGFRFGDMQLTIQQGFVSSYERSLIVLEAKPEQQQEMRLSAGDLLLSQIRQAAGGAMVEAIYPAYRPSLADDQLRLEPVWAVRLASGEVRIAQ